MGIDREAKLPGTNRIAISVLHRRDITVAKTMNRSGRHLNTEIAMGK